jgi:hypothetical protein
LGRAVGNSNWVVAAEPCIGAFFAEVKHNTSIVEAKIVLQGQGISSVDDLTEFIRNSEALKHVSLTSEEVLSLEQWTVLSRVIHGAQLQSAFVVINYRCFENGESFQQLLEGCSRVDRLDVFCENLARTTHSALQ